MENTRILVTSVYGDIDRQDLERIEGVEFNSVSKVYEMFAKEGKDTSRLAWYTLWDFTSMCNDSDSSVCAIDIMNSWVGYVTIAD